MKDIEFNDLTRERAYIDNLLKIRELSQATHVCTELGDIRIKSRKDFVEILQILKKTIHREYSERLVAMIEYESKQKKIKARPWYDCV